MILRFRPTPSSILHNPRKVIVRKSIEGKVHRIPPKITLKPLRAKFSSGRVKKHHSRPVRGSLFANVIATGSFQERGVLS